MENTGNIEIHQASIPKIKESDLRQTKEPYISKKDLKTGMFDILKEKSLGIRSISANLKALIIPKSSLYSTAPGLDNMILLSRVSRSTERARNIGSLTTEEIQKSIQFAQELLDYYKTLSPANDPITKGILAINFHPHPISDKVFSRSSHAQTLKDFHIHVTGFRTSDEYLTTPKRLSELNKQAREELIDPMTPLINALMNNTIIREKLTQGMEHVSIDSYNNQHGLNLKLPRSELTALSTAKELKQLHENFNQVYDEIRNIYTIPDKFDSTGMPILRPEDERKEQINAYFDSIQDGFAMDEHGKLSIKRLLLFLGSNLKSGEAMQAQVQQDKDMKVFLQGPAYTLRFLDELGKENIEISLMPRIFSAGNAMSDMGIYRNAQKPTKASFEWLKSRKENEMKICEKFGQST
jgi:hypothetical protein